MKIFAKCALPSSNWLSLAEHAGLVAVAAGLAALVQNLGPADFGVWTPLVTAGATVLLTYVKKVIENPAEPTPPSPEGGTDFPL